MPDGEIEIERCDGDASIETNDSAAVIDDGASDSSDKELPTRTATDANDRELTAHHPAKASLSSSAESDPHKRKREAGIDDEQDYDRFGASEADACARQFSLAQVRVQVKRARLEANIAVQDDIKALRFAVLAAEQHAQARAHETEQAERRVAALQKSMDDIVKMHQRTLLSLRDDLKLETLVASLDKEKSIKATLRASYQQQNAALVRAQQRVAALEAQIAQYQKTETVLAQSIAHFEEQYASKDHERAAMIDRVKRTAEAQHIETRRALESDVERLEHERNAVQEQLQQLQTEHVGLQETAQAVIEMQEKREAELDALRARAARFDTDKAVLESKVDQVQKADAQLRCKIQTLEEQLLQRQHDNDVLRRENVELAKIATDLMDMAEQQHVEKQQILQTPDKDGDERLAATRTRLRESLG